ncbi:bifunctional Ubiquitin specific protease domain/Peptidase C19 [Babesia duncani]|uniref:Bifunctional Ubiquitin specific protease domain/Peptidase C19 n=1 Tax=Babesia duncani TaxID=323732 RepID=A0AAD9UPX1_9APIC|nr:bifunctional Ubiquitin specific protease domain/Peptidase C19 [Babesia duncani]
MDICKTQNQQVPHPAPCAKGIYEVVSFLSHVGATANSGHYLCHIKRNGQWVTFNDSQVTACNNVPLDAGYFYLFKRKD